MSTKVPTSSEEPLVYQPLSGFAVAGFTVSALYAAIVLYAAYRAFLQGDPLIVPGYMLLLPLAGIVLSILGQVHIRNSEGTRAGMTLTRWGLGLSICVGLSYFAYSQATSLAVRSQANQFMMELGEDSGFFPRLMKASRPDRKDFNAAFLLTLKPQDRLAANPNNDKAMREKYAAQDAEGGGGPLTAFSEHPLTRFFMRGAENEMKVEPLGVMEWSYSKSGFTIRRYYRLTNEESVAEAIVTVNSIEGREGETRKWMVSLGRDTGLERPELTAAGRVMEKVRNGAERFLIAWLSGGEKWAGFSNVDRTDWEAAVRGDPALRKRLQTAAREWFDDKRSFAMPIRPMVKESSWRRDEGKIRMEIPIKLEVADPFALTGFIELSSRDNVGPIAEGLNPAWEVTGIRFEQLQVKGKGPL